MRVLPYLSPHLVFLVLISGFAVGETWVFRQVAWFWLIVITLDLLIGSGKHYRSERRTADDRKTGLVWSLILWSIVPLQMALITCGLLGVSAEGVSLREFIVFTVSIGFIGGIFSIPVAHELMHRQTRYERALAVIILTTFTYPHFCIEHVYGHHRNIGRPEDSATARLGESFYAFYHRAIVDGFFNAWRLEGSRLRRLGRPVFGFGNRMIRYSIILVVGYVAVGYYFGWVGAIFFGTQSIIGFTTLEVINYVQHYGLVRRRTRSGRYEKVKPIHSWNSDHVFSNWILFNLPRHSDHHDDTLKSYQSLRHIEKAPQLPCGYFGLFFLSLIPPLWRRIMDPRVEAWRREHGVAYDAFPFGEVR